MTPSRWRGDCSRCAALCCLSLAFDRSESFAFDKAAGEPCRLLAADHGCSIHAERERRGFGGCIGYDCRGAGQRVTQELFGGRSWRAEPALARPMSEAFWRLRRVHELLAGLALTERLALDPERARRRRELERVLDPPGGFEPGTLEALPLEAAAHAVRELLSGLRDRLTPETSDSSNPARRRLPLALVAEPAQPTRSASHTITSSRRAKCVSAGGPSTSSPCEATMLLSRSSTSTDCSGHAG
jgi:hypothetical protein